MSEQRTGLGYDAHRLEQGRPLVLGGVEIPHARGLAGWSDADVLLHALMDALLGAAGLGDIGEHFPPGDERWAGADSLALLGEVAGMLRAAGWAVVNVDAMVVLEEPRIGPHREEMRSRIAAALQVDAARVGVKATTNEGMGFVGAGEGAAALCVALVERHEPPAAQA